jgi:hypothetical protein
MDYEVFFVEVSADMIFFFLRQPYGGVALEPHFEKAIATMTHLR